MPILELANRDPEMIAVGKLVREGREFEFRYKNLPGSRTYTREDPSDGLIRLKAAVSIVTNDNLGFTFGDKIRLEGDKRTYRVVNMTIKSNHRQLMFLKTVTQKEITLDLE